MKNKLMRIAKIITARPKGPKHKNDPKTEEAFYMSFPEMKTLLDDLDKFIQKNRIIEYKFAPKKDPKKIEITYGTKAVFELVLKIDASKKKAEMTIVNTSDKQFEKLNNDYNISSIENVLKKLGLSVKTKYYPSKR